LLLDEECIRIPIVNLVVTAQITITISEINNPDYFGLAIYDKLYCYMGLQAFLNQLNKTRIKLLMILNFLDP